MRKLILGLLLCGTAQAEAVKIAYTGDLEIDAGTVCTYTQAEGDTLLTVGVPKEFGRTCQDFVIVVVIDEREKT